MKKGFILFIMLFALLLAGCGSAPPEPVNLQGEQFTIGFGSSEISLPKKGKLYIAGYHNGREISGVLDLQRANALWLGTEEKGVLFISVDCVGLSSETVGKIREKLAGFCEETHCLSVNVFSTHDHAGVDTLGLWGPIGRDGKNKDFMKNLENACVSAAETAYASRKTGRLYYGEAEALRFQEDSRRPTEFDQTLRQFRFVPETGNGIRLVLFACHAEALGGENTLVSRDYPGAFSDSVKAKTGDDVLFLQGAIGGLIKPRTAENGTDEEIMKSFGERLADVALSITRETEVEPSISLYAEEFSVPLENPIFVLYRLLGILKNPVSFGKNKAGIVLDSSLSLFTIGDKTLALLPGELFPELLSGGTGSMEDPEPLSVIAKRYGVTDLIAVGLANDELGYIIPPSDFIVDKSFPYFREGKDARGESHYEETNSTGSKTAEKLAEALEKLLQERAK